MGKGPKEHFLNYSLRASGGLIVLAGAVSGLTILSYQVYFWLSVGKWLEFPMTYFLEKAGADLLPVYHPQEWRGLASVVRFIIDTRWLVSPKCWLHIDCTSCFFPMAC